MNTYTCVSVKIVNHFVAKKQNRNKLPQNTNSSDKKPHTHCVLYLPPPPKKNKQKSNLVFVNMTS